MLKRSLTYLRESRSELGRVTWPTRSEVIGSTRIVLAVILMFTVLIGVADALLGLGITEILGI